MNQNTIERTYRVFIRLYNKIDFQSITKDFEDEVSSLMLDSRVNFFID